MDMHHMRKWKKIKLKYEFSGLCNDELSHQYTVIFGEKYYRWRPGNSRSGNTLEIWLFVFPVSRDIFAGKPGKIEPCWRPYFTLFCITFLRFKVECECCNAVVSCNMHCINCSWSGHQYHGVRGGPWVGWGVGWTLGGWMGWVGTGSGWHAQGCMKISWTFIVHLVHDLNMACKY